MRSVEPRGLTGRYGGRAIALPFTVVGIAFTAVGLTLFLQPHRYDNTPSYANLLNVMNQAWWGLIYLVVAAFVFAAVTFWRHRLLTVAAHTSAAALVLSWLAAFVYRWLTDDGTTIVNVVSWSILLFLVVRSMFQLDEWPESGSEYER